MIPTITMNIKQSYIISILSVLILANCAVKHKVNNNLLKNNIAQNKMYIISNAPEDSTEVEYIMENINNLACNLDRKVTKRNWKALFKGGTDNRPSGVITLKVYVNKAGDVKRADILYDQTTIRDIVYLERALNAAMGYKYEPNQAESIIECTNLVFTLDLKSNK